MLSKRPFSRATCVRAALATGLLAGTLGVIGSDVSASHVLASLPGSTFEIDDDANLKQEDTGFEDWGSLAEPPEMRAMDAPTGKDDDSYKGGVKEDTECPDEVTGSIPNNKSDLLTVHAYTEPGTGGHPGFFNFAWSRVSDPSGTTLMDFEFNQSNTPCAQGPNFERTDGDLLIEYAIDQGGARASIDVRRWDDGAAAWGPSEPLDQGTACGGGPCAVGTINKTTIPAADADGLGEKQPRTFGEAQLDLRFIFESNKCTSFGSVMVKSRSSDSFTSQLKDFITPIPINLQNCGQVIIRKQTDPDGATAVFGYTKSFPTDPATGDTFTLMDDGTKDFGDDVLFGSGYTVTEDVIPSGWDFVSVDCSASTAVTPVISGATVTFAIDSASDVLDCTYNNRARGTIVVEKITNDGSGAFDFTSSTLTPSPFTLTTTAAGAGGKDARTFGDLVPGTYDVAETVPAGWNLASSSCDDGSDPATIGLSGGETVTCTFTNEREQGAILITKTRKHAADGPGDHPHAGVTFTVTGGELTAGVEAVTDANGQACVDGLVLSSFVGDYTVTESLPGGYAADGDLAKTVSVTAESSCGDTNEAAVGFGNTPLTDVTVSVDSQVDGGTASTIVCTDADGNVSNKSTDPDGDGNLKVSDLLPTDPTVTLTCEITIDP